MNKILGLLGKEEFIKEGGTHEGEKVSMDFMLFHQKVRAVVDTLRNNLYPKRR